MALSILKDGIEYLWQGDSKYWKRRDANLFPYVGRLKNGHYWINGHRYSLGIHGFCLDTPFQIESQNKHSVTLKLTESTETLLSYPFFFEYRITYTLEQHSIIKTCFVTNNSQEIMYFGLGSHPGFQVPINNEGDFSDWFCEFPEGCSPTRIEFNQESYLLTGSEHPFILKQGNNLLLSHELFDQDAIVLRETKNTVNLKSNNSAHSIQVSYPDMPFLGLWHPPRTNAPFLCIEPWLSLRNRLIITR